MFSHQRQRKQGNREFEMSIGTSRIPKQTDLPIILSNFLINRSPRHVRLCSAHWGQGLLDICRLCVNAYCIYKYIGIVGSAIVSVVASVSLAIIDDLDLEAELLSVGSIDLLPITITVCAQEISLFRQVKEILRENRYNKCNKYIQGYTRNRLSDTTIQILVISKIGRYIDQYRFFLCLRHCTSI